jgi:hypothetical protein
MNRTVAAAFRDGRYSFGVGGQSGNLNDPHRVQHWRRPGQAWSCCQPCSAGWQPDGRQQLIYELVAKRLALLRELVPLAVRVAVLVNPANAQTETTLRDVEAAARPAVLQIQIAKAGTARDIDAAFAALVRDRVDALFVPPDPLFISRRIQLVQLAARHVLPATIRCATLPKLAD